MFGEPYPRWVTVDLPKRPAKVCTFAVMNVRVNGRDRELPDGCTIAKLVESLGYGARQVVVEHNGEAVERSRFAQTRVAGGDIVEVVRAVAGG